MRTTAAAAAGSGVSTLNIRNKRRVACIGCGVRKAKCSGKVLAEDRSTLPCRRCQISQRECIWPDEQATSSASSLNSTALEQSGRSANQNLRTASQTSSNSSSSPELSDTPSSAVGTDRPKNKRTSPPGDDDEDESGSPPETISTSTTSTPTSTVALSQTSNRLTKVQLSGALSYHLVQCALALTEEAQNVVVQHTKLVESSSFTDYVFLSPGQQQAYDLGKSFFDAGMDQSLMEPIDEFMFARAVVVGSRRTSHSAIVGQCIPQNPTVSPGAGKRREAACLVFSQRLIDITLKHGFLTINSVQNFNLIRSLQASLSSAFPNHRSLPLLVHSMHKQRKALLMDPRLSLDDIKNLKRDEVFNLPWQDAFYAMKTRNRLLFSDQEVEHEYRLTKVNTDRIVEWMIDLSNKEWQDDDMDGRQLYEDFFAVHCGFLRKIVQLRETSDSIDPMTLVQELRCMGQRLDQMTRFYIVKLQQVVAKGKSEVYDAWWSSLGGNQHLILMIATNIYEFFDEMTIGLTSSPEFELIRHEMKREWQIRVIEEFAEFVKIVPMINAHDFMIPYTLLHVMAFQLYGLGTGWENVLVDAARDEDDEARPDHLPPFPLEKVELILEATHRACYVFGLLEARAESLEVALEHLRPRRLRRRPEQGTETLSADLVSAALADLIE